MTVWQFLTKLVPCKAKTALLNIYPAENKKLHTDVHSIFIHNCHNLEATKMLFSTQRDTQARVHPENGIVFGTQQTKKLSNHEKTQEANPNISEAIWSQTYILYDSNYMTFWKRQKCGDGKKIGGFQEKWGVGWGGRGETPRTFRAVKYSIGYHGIMIGYISLYICQNPWNVQGQEWTWVSTTDLRW